MRAFIAIDLPPAVKNALGKIQRELMSANCPVRWVNPEGMHLTLKFLGETDTSMSGKIGQVLGQALADMRPFRLHLAEARAFPDAFQPRIAWVGLGGETEKLKNLFRLVESSTSKLGYPSETQPFRPHLTLGRVHPQASLTDKTALGRSLAVTTIPNQAFPAKSVRLFRSQLTPSGAVYTVLGAWRLG
ncbi:RNA 2',3'-cyclic phosphodiesterase [Chloroflexota bacterium]